jgi:hypothetical protein
MSSSMPGVAAALAEIRFRAHKTLSCVHAIVSNAIPQHLVQLISSTPCSSSSATRHDAAFGRPVVCALRHRSCML